jgi:CHAT domain-containing protein/tetratricopeptide (TPR) repeat protein
MPQLLSAFAAKLNSGGLPAKRAFLQAAPRPDLPILSNPFRAGGHFGVNDTTQAVLTRKLTCNPSSLTPFSATVGQSVSSFTGQLPPPAVSLPTRSTEPRPNAPKKRLLLPLAAAAAVCGGVACNASREAVARPPVMEELVRAMPARVFTPRLSIPMAYRPCTPDTVRAGDIPRERCGEAGDTRLNLKRLAAAGDSFDPDSARASGVSGLLWGNRDEGALDDAIQALERALRLSSDSVPLLVDLSAAHMLRAEHSQNALDLLVSLERALEAMSLDSTNVDAAFNAALAIDRIGLHDEAVKAWEAYLSLDSASPWAADARRSLRVLRTVVPPLPDPVAGANAAQLRQFVERDRQRAREFGFGKVLGAWGNAVLRGKTAAAAAQLALAEGLAAALDRPGMPMDHSLEDAVKAIHDAEGDTSATAALARAHVAFYKGEEHLTAGERTEARIAYERVLGAAPPSPVLIQYAEAHYAAMVQLYGSEEPRRPLLDSVLSHVNTALYPALEARTLWFVAKLNEEQEDYVPARLRYLEATQIFDRLSETENEATTLGNSGEIEHARGDTLVGYQQLHRAVILLRGHRTSIRLHSQLTALAGIAVEDGLIRAAFVLQEEGAAVALGLNDLPHAKVEALTARARMRMSNGDTTGARRDIDSAKVFAAQVHDSAQLKWTDDLIRFGRLVVERPLLGAVYDSATNAFHGKPTWLVPTLIFRSDARLSARDSKGALRDLDSAMAYVRNVSRADAAWLRATVLDKQREHVDRMVMLAVRRGLPEEALLALERGRVSLFAARGTPAGPPRSRRGETAVEIALIGDTLLTWTVRGDSVSMECDTVNRGDLLRRIERVGIALEASASAATVNSRLSSLYDLLLRPVAGHLGRPGAPVVLLVDGEIAAIPFAALRDSARGRYLIEDHPLRYAATLSDAAAPPPAWEAGGRALLVGDPTFNAQFYPKLDPLPVAGREADTLRGIYPDHTILKGSAATVEAFMAAAPGARIIHYAGHSFFDDTRPERSYLLLAGADTTGRLRAGEVEEMNLRGVRLVVLSACRTLRARQGRSGGFAGLSRSLLMAGAGGVVGAMWEVDDELTLPVMVAFHEKYAESGDPAAALAAAQLKMIALNDTAASSPAVWAAFRYAGP